MQIILNFAAFFAIAKINMIISKQTLSNIFTIFFIQRIFSMNIRNFTGNALHFDSHQSPRVLPVGR